MRERAGDLLLRLGYLRSAEKLTVVILRARNLNSIGGDGEHKQPGIVEVLEAIVYH